MVSDRRVGELAEVRDAICGLDPVGAILSDCVDVLDQFAEQNGRLTSEVQQLEGQATRLGVDGAQLRRLRRQLADVATACRRACRADQQLHAAVERLQATAAALELPDDDGDE
jgi:ABC-type transporter Mla subunit MlaD